MSTCTVLCVRGGDEFVMPAASCSQLGRAKGEVQYLSVVCNLSSLLLHPSFQKNKFQSEMPEAFTVWDTVKCDDLKQLKKIILSQEDRC